MREFFVIIICYFKSRNEERILKIRKTFGYVDSLKQIWNVDNWKVGQYKLIRAMYELEFQWKFTWKREARPIEVLIFSNPVITTYWETMASFDFVGILKHILIAKETTSFLFSFFTCVFSHISIKKYKFT